MFTVHEKDFFVDILCSHILCPQKPHAMLFYHGTRIQRRRHLATAAPCVVMRMAIDARHMKTR
jgi:hypothetical protein